MTGPIVDRHHRRKSAAQFVREEFGVPVSEQFLAKAAVSGGGPRYYKFSRFPVYRESDLISWVKEKLGSPRQSTSESKDKDEDGGMP